ncbi:MAG: hypothetical protein ABJJ05_03370 [Maribacter litoralis]|uniref:hypothetical protein n=1 Tax=Maribacter litoralis TaxID=2059726 RepID=UPI003296DE60
MFAKIIVVFLSLFLVACNDNDDAEQQDCSEAICTHNFVTITVSVKDEAGDAVSLDNFEVIDTATGENLAESTTAEEYHNDQGIYPIISDAYRTKYQNNTATLLFKGFIGDEQVVNEEFEIGADCCHVSLIAGNRTIVLD